MSIVIIRGDLFNTNFQTLVNPVNCIGVMGKGLALAFKRRFPEMYKDYIRRCQWEEVVIGKPYLYVQSPTCSIINFPTKVHWKQPSRIEYVEKGLQYLLDHYVEWGVQSLAVPALGCGNGNLLWQDVEPLMMQYLSQMSIPVEIYAPF